MPIKDTGSESHTNVWEKRRRRGGELYRARQGFVVGIIDEDELIAIVWDHHRLNNVSLHFTVLLSLSRTHALVSPCLSSYILLPSQLHVGIRTFSAFTASPTMECATSSLSRSRSMEYIKHAKSQCRPWRGGVCMNEVKYAI